MLFFYVYKKILKVHVSLLNQKTIKNTVNFKGVGLHSGKVVNLCLKSSEPDTGIVFKRIDLKKDNIVHPNFLNKNKYIVKKRDSSFPFEIFLLFGDNYVSDRSLGKKCHKKRINFEQNFLKTKNEKILDKFYEKLAEINLGRTAIIYAKNK